MCSEHPSASGMKKTSLGWDDDLDFQRLFLCHLLRHSIYSDWTNSRSGDETNDDDDYRQKQPLIKDVRFDMMTRKKFR